MILPAISGAAATRPSGASLDERQSECLRVVKVSFPTVSTRASRPRPPVSLPTHSAAAGLEPSEDPSVASLAFEEEDGATGTGWSPLRLGRAAALHSSGRRSPPSALRGAGVCFREAVVKDCIFVPQFEAAPVPARSPDAFSVQIARAASSGRSSSASAEQKRRRGLGGPVVSASFSFRSAVRRLWGSQPQTAGAASRSVSLDTRFSDAGEEGPSLKDLASATKASSSSGDSRAAGRLASLLGTAGAAVGMSVLWRFPAYCHKWGGGSFLVPYSLLLFLLGVPLLGLELALGQAFRGGILKVLGLIAPSLRGLAAGSLLLSFFICCYNSALVSWSLRFLAASLGPSLPWVASEAQLAVCASLTPAECAPGSAAAAFSEGGVSFCRWEKETELAQGRCVVDAEALALNFLHSQVLQTDAAGAFASPAPAWSVYALVAVVWLSAFLLSLKGSRGVAAVSACAVLLPVACLAGILWKSLSLAGAAEGVLKLSRVDWGLLASEPAVWGEALSQVLFSLGLFQGVMATFAGDRATAFNSTLGALAAGVWTFLISALSAAAAFAVCGALDAESGSARGSLLSGPQLVFVLFPVGMSRLPAPQLFCALFFFAFALLGLNSIVCVVHAVLAMLREAQGVSRELRRWQLALVPCIWGAVFSFPFALRTGVWIVEAADALWGVVGLLFVGACQTMAFGWVYGFERQARLVGKPAASVLLGGFISALALGGFLGFFGRSYATTAVALTCAFALWLTACGCALFLALQFAKEKKRRLQRASHAAAAAAAWRAQMAETLGDDFSANGFVDPQPSDAVFDAGCWAPPSPAGVQTARDGHGAEVAAAAATLPAGEEALENAFRGGEVRRVAEWLFVANVEHLRRHLNLVAAAAARGAAGARKGGFLCCVRLPAPWSILVRYVAPAVVAILLADALRLEFVSPPEVSPPAFPENIRAAPLALLAGLVAFVGVGIAAPGVFWFLEPRDEAASSKAAVESVQGEEDSAAEAVVRGPYEEGDALSEASVPSTEAPPQESAGRRQRGAGDKAAAAEVECMDGP